ncbi:MAG: hypothetical protein JSS49_10055 [Planctomycetes bacterium]|nr:hypothetical protein [Planctomycetota bacterium]
MSARRPDHPYLFFLKITARSPDYYELLGVTRFTNDVVAIKQAAQERNRALKSWDNSEYYLWSNELLSEVVAALLVLESPAAKAEYDQRLREQLKLNSPPIEFAALPTVTSGTEPTGVSSRIAPVEVQPEVTFDPQPGTGRSVWIAAALLLVIAMVGFWFPRHSNDDIPSAIAVANVPIASTSSNPPVTVAPAGERLFTAAAIRFPYVYVLDGRSDSSDLWVYTLPETFKSPASAVPELILQLIPSKGARPALPREVPARTESYWLPDVGTGRDLVVRGQYLLVPKAERLQVLDLTNPAEPLPLRPIRAISSEDVLAIVENGDYLLLLTQGTVRIFDVSDPALPRLVSSMDSPRPMRCGCVVGNRFYGGVFDQQRGDHGVVIYDITDPVRPREIGFHKLAVPPYHIASISENRLAVAEKLIRYFDITNPDSLQELDDALDPAGTRTLTLFAGERPGLFTGSTFHPLAGASSTFSPGADCTRDAPYRGCCQGEFAVVTADKEVLVFRGASASGLVVRGNMTFPQSSKPIAKVELPLPPVPMPLTRPVARPFPDLSQVKSADLMSAAKSIQAGLKASSKDKSVAATRHQLELVLRNPADPSERLIAIDLMRRVAWPVDDLDRTRIPGYSMAIAGFAGTTGARPGPASDGAPAELVAVLGDGRLAEWSNVTSLAVSPDASRVASACGGNVVSIWDGSSGEPLRTLTALNRIAEGCLAFSPTDHLLAASSGSELIIWDVETGEQTIGTKPNAVLNSETSLGSITSIAFSPDGQTVAVAGRQNSVDFVDVNSGLVVRTFPGHRQETSQLHFSPTGEYLASAGADGQYWLNMVSDGKLVVAIHENQRNTQWLACGFAANSWVTASAELDGGFVVFDLPTQKQRPLPVKSGRVQSLVVVEVTARPPGPKKSAAVGKVTDEAIVHGDVDKVVAHSLKNGQLLHVIDGYLERPLVAASSNSQFLATAGRTISVWDPATWRQTPQWGALPQTREFEVHGMAVRPDGRQLAVLRAMNSRRGPVCSVALYDLQTGELVREQPGPPRFHGRAIAFSPDGKLLSIAGGATEAEDEDLGVLATYDPAHGRFEVGKPLSKLQLDSVLFSADGTIVVGGKSSIIAIDGKSGAIQTLGDRTEGSSTLSASADGTRFASCRERTVSVWDAITGAKLHSISLKSSSQCVAMNPDGSVVVAGDSQSVAVYEATGNRQAAVNIAPLNAEILSVDFSPDGRHLAASDSSGTVSLLTTSPLQVSKQWQIGPGFSKIRQVCFTPDSRHLLTLNPNGTVYALRLEPIPVP